MANTVSKCVWWWSPKMFTNYLSQISSNFYPNIKSLLTILATLLVTTVITECSISTYRRLKTCLRNNIGQGWPTDLALMNIYRNDYINIDEVINKFAKFFAYTLFASGDQ